MKESNTQIRLKEIMEDRQLKQVDILNLAKPYCKKYDVKLNKSDISQYLSGKATPNQDKLAILSMALNINEGWLMGYDVSIERMPRDITNSKDILKYTALDASMSPLLDVGDIAYVEKKGTFEDGDTILFKIENNEYIRRVNDKDDHIEFIAMNPYFPIIILKKNEFDEKKFTIIGKVIKAENQSAFK